MVSPWRCSQITLVSSPWPQWNSAKKCDKTDAQDTGHPRARWGQEGPQTCSDHLQDGRVSCTQTVPNKLHTPHPTLLCMLSMFTFSQASHSHLTLHSHFRPFLLPCSQHPNTKYSMSSFIRSHLSNFSCNSLSSYSVCWGNGWKGAPYHSYIF